MAKPAHLRADLLSGFLVFLIALPLCLGISLAGGVPAISGVLTAIVGGLVASFLGSSRLTIKGPPAGLIVIVLGASMELSDDPIVAYHRLLAVSVVSGLLQIVLALLRAGTLGDLMPSSVIHGMLAAIGVIIIAKQAHVALGVTPMAGEPLGLLMEIPHSLLHPNPAVFLIGGLALIMLFGLPLLKIGWLKKIPAPMLVLLMAIPLGLYFNLGTEHTYQMFGNSYTVGPKFLIQLPGSLLGSLAFPDFSVIFTPVSIKYIVMFLLVGSIESLLTVSAVDTIDPEKQTSDINKDYLATGIANTVAAFIGGTPGISEIVRTRANIDNGAKTAWANFFHGAFLLLSLALIPGVIQMIPQAALAAMLVYTGYRLAAPKEFAHAYHVGVEQLFLFSVTLAVTVSTDLLIGVATGLVCKILLHLKNGAPIKSMLKAIVKEEEKDGRLTLTVHESAIFTNFLAIKTRLQGVGPEVKEVVIDFDNAWVVDHTVLDKLDRFASKWEGERKLTLTGLGEHTAMSSHSLAARRKQRREKLVSA